MEKTSQNRSLQIDPSRALVRGSLGGFVINILGVLVGFLLHLYLARTMGVHEFGSYMYAISWISILVIFAGLGVEASAFRFVAAYTAVKDYSRLRGLIHRGFEVVIISSVVLSLLVYFLMQILSGFVSVEFKNEMIIAVLLLPVWILASFNQTTLASLKRTVASRFPEAILKPILIIVLAFLFLTYYSDTLSAKNVLLIHLVALAISLVVASLILKRSLPKEIKNVSPIFETSLWIKTGCSLMMISGIYIALNQFDILMIGIFQDNKEVGVYSIAYRISQFVAFTAQAIYLIAAPLISELVASNAKKELFHFVRRVTNWVMIGAVPIFIVIILGGNLILDMFGDEFSSGYWVLVILAISQLSSSIVGPVSYMLTMSGNQKLLLNILAKALVINMILNVPLIYYFGVIGAAIATCLATVFSNVLLVIKTKSTLGYSYYDNYVKEQ